MVLIAPGVLPALVIPVSYGLQAVRRFCPGSPRPEGDSRSEYPLLAEVVA